MINEIGKDISLLYRKNQMFWAQFLYEDNVAAAEYPLLIVLNCQDGITQEQLAEKLDIHKSAVTRLLKTLEEKHFIERRRDDTDLRCNHIFLTTNGKRVWSSIEAGMQQWQEITLAGFHEQEIVQLREMLDKMNQNMKEYLQKNQMEK